MGRGQFIWPNWQHEIDEENASVFTDFADPRTTAFDPIIFE